MITVSIANVKPLEEPALFQSAMDMASPQRREKVLGLRLMADRARSLGAELLLYHALKERGLAFEELRYTYGPYGKPAFLGQDGFSYNLSHSGDYVMLAAAEQEIGCDIQRMGSENMKLARRFFTREEVQSLEALGESEERRDLFFRLWTLKESFLKATGRGLSLPLNAFQIVIGPDGMISPLPYDDGKTYHFAEPQPVPGYRCAVCMADFLEKVECRVVDLREILLLKKE